MRLLQVLFSAISFTFVFANSMATMEVLGDPHSDCATGNANCTTSWFTIEKESKNAWNVVNAIYYTWVTISTVGYGDISPESYVGRLMAIVFIVYGLYFFGTVTTEIFESIDREQKGYGFRFLKPTDRHAVLVGGADAGTVSDFTHEFLHHDHAPMNTDFSVTLLQTGMRNDALQDLILTLTLTLTLIGRSTGSHPNPNPNPNPNWNDALQDLMYQNRATNALTYIEGDVHNSEDCERSKIAESKAVFFVPSLTANGPQALQEDRANVLGVIALDHRQR